MNGKTYARMESFMQILDDYAMNGGIEERSLDLDRDYQEVVEFYNALELFFRGESK